MTRTELLDAEVSADCETAGQCGGADDALELAERVNFRMQSSRIPECHNGTEIRTERIHRTWLDKLLFWKCAYQTRVFDAHREAFGAWPDR